MTEFDGVAMAPGQALTKRGYTGLTPVQTAILAPQLKDPAGLAPAHPGSG